MPVTLEQRGKGKCQLDSMKTIKLTTKLIHTAGSYGRHGFNRRQLSLLRVHWPPRAGWIRWLDGQEIPETVWNQVLALKGKSKERERKDRAGWY